MRTGRFGNILINFDHVTHIEVDSKGVLAYFLGGDQKRFRGEEAFALAESFWDSGGVGRGGDSVIAEMRKEASRNEEVPA